MSAFNFTENPFMSCIYSPLIREIGEALDHKQTFSVIKQNGCYKVKKEGFFSSIWHWKDAKFHQDRLNLIARTLAEILKKTERRAPEQADLTPEVIIARKFLKSIPQPYSKNKDMTKCRTQLLALRLGISSKALKKNPGFQEFAQQNVLYNYLMTYKHVLKTDKETQEIQILSNGKYKPWKEASAELKEPPKASDKPHLAWRYGKKGIQNDDMYNWTKLKPFMKDDPSKWGNQYGFAFCTCCVDDPRFVGDHTWIRLYTPEGHIYSLGLYRPGKRNHLDHWKFPLRYKKGELMMPDISEFWNVGIQTIFIAINKEQFLKIKHQVETDKKNDKQIFQLFKGNCTQYANRLAAMAGIRLPTEGHIARLFAPRIIRKVCDAFFGKLPKVAKKISECVLAFFVNIFLLAFGAGKIDSTVKKMNIKNLKPPISSIFHLFRRSNLHLHHPYQLGVIVRKNIVDWRNKQIERLEKRYFASDKLEEKKRKILFSIPRKFRIQPASA